MYYDYLVVGAGLFAATFCERVKKDKKCLVIERRKHIGGNVYTELQENINVHKYGAHIFHTSDKSVWDYVNGFAKFNGFINSPIANFRGEKYHLPFNMNTFSELWGIKTAEEAKAIIESQSKSVVGEPKNLEEQAIKMVGTDIYEKLVKGYTEKQWGRSCRDLPSFIIKRLPLRFEYNNNYFSDVYQGIPIGGYTQIIEKMLSGVMVKTDVDYKSFIANTTDTFGKIIFTGRIDEFFDYQLGRLDFRSLRFEEETLSTPDFQGNAVINYTAREVPYTRIIECKHFENAISPKTVIIREYPADWQEGMEAYYPINDERNNALYQKYAELALSRTDVIFAGRLGEYKYYDMDKTIISARKLVESMA